MSHFRTYKSFKTCRCPTCGGLYKFEPRSDGAYHCPVCDTRVFYTNGKIVKVEPMEKKEDA